MSNGKLTTDPALRGRKTRPAGTGQDPTAQSSNTGSKQDLILSMLRRSEGTTVPSIMAATGWQSHSVRGFLSSVVRKKFGLPLTSEMADGARVYRTTAPKPVRSRSKKVPADSRSPE